MAVNLHTTQYRFGIDELAESTHGWYAAQNTNPAGNAIAPGVTFLLRFNVQETGGTAAGNTDFQFRVAVNGGAFQDITTGSTIVKAVDPAAFADGANCTQRVAGTGTFESSGAGCTIDGLSGGATNDIAASGCSETECGLQIIAANVKAGDVLTFALTSPDFTITNDVVPTLTLVASPEEVRRSQLPVVPPVFATQRKQNILHHVVNLLQSTLAPVVAATTQLVGSAMALPRRLAWKPESVVSVGLLLTTLGGVAPPIVPQSWANPRGPTRSTDLLTWVQRSLIEEVAPSGKSLLDLPPRGAKRAGTLETWVQGTPPETPAETRPFFQTSWPRPGGWRSLLTWAQGSLLETPAPIPVGTQYDFPNPKVPARSNNLQTLVGRVAGEPSAVVVTLPDGKTAWSQNPRSPSRAFQPVLGGTNPALFPAVVVTLPDGRATDWIVPRSVPRAVNLRVFAGRSLTEDSPRNAFSTPWPNPRIAARALQATPLGSSLQLVTTPIPVLYQIKQSEWTNPRRAPQAFQQTPLGSSQLLLNTVIPVLYQISQRESTGLPNPLPTPRAFQQTALGIPPAIITPPSLVIEYYDIWHYYTGM